MDSIRVYSLRQVKEKEVKYNLDEKTVSDPSTIFNILTEVLDLSEQAQEMFGIIMLNTKNKIIGLSVISTGTLNQSLVHPREVFKQALVANSNSIVLFHNHPSGDTTPSKDDIDITSRLVEGGKILGVNILDHIIVGDGFLSFAERQLL